MRVLVTGATGRLGGNFVSRLVSRGIDVTAMIAPRDPQRRKLDRISNVQIVEADLRDQAAIDVACHGVTHIVHLAAQLGRHASRTDQYWDINVFGTLRLLEGVVHAGLALERFVLASSDAIYRPGDPPTVPLREEDAQDPADYYGTSKLLSEIILRNHAAQFDIPFSIVRFATMISPEESTTKFRLGSQRALLKRAEQGKESNIWQLFRGQTDLLKILDAAAGHADDDIAVGFVGPGGDPWTLHMVDVRDAAEGVYRALTKPEAMGATFNIAAAEPTSHEEGASAISDVFGVTKIIVEMPITWRLELDIHAARKNLGYQPKYNYRDMLAAATNATDTPGERFIPARV